jgi:hypothetical protein
LARFTLLLCLYVDSLPLLVLAQLLVCRLLSVKPLTHVFLPSLQLFRLVALFQLYPQLISPSRFAPFLPFQLDPSRVVPQLHGLAELFFQAQVTFVFLLLSFFNGLLQLPFQFFLFPFSPTKAYPELPFPSIA